MGIYTTHKEAYEAKKALPKKLQWSKKDAEKMWDWFQILRLEAISEV